MKLLAWSGTDPGRKRAHNEDNLLVAPTLQLFAVADGMGGHQGGEHASRVVIEVMEQEIALVEGDFDAAVERMQRRTEVADDQDLFDDETVRRPPQGGPYEPPTAAGAVMIEAARRASSTVFAMAADNPSLRGMGTTLTAMLYHGGKMHFCHAGDSRGYLLRDGQLQQLTSDHSWIQEQLDLGMMTEAEAKESQFRHIITRSVGFENDVEVDSMGVAVEAGDCYLLCSDGLTNFVEGEDLAAIMRNTWFRDLPQTLIDTANERGGDDNITVVVVYAANDAS